MGLIDEIPAARLYKMALAVSLIYGLGAIWIISLYAAPAQTTGGHNGGSTIPGFTAPKEKEDVLHEEGWPGLKFETVHGFFLQDANDTEVDGFDYIKENFGLKHLEGRNPSAPSWKHFHLEIERLNAKAPEDVVYKVFFLGRHGQGYHNAAGRMIRVEWRVDCSGLWDIESYYGKHLWDCYWSMLDGNGTTVWADPELTEQGVKEARAANAAWKKQISYGLEQPASFYSSPLIRSATTLNHTFYDIHPEGTKPIVKELFRETIGIHTCDRRSSKSIISERLPHFTFEGTFTQADKLWNPWYRETVEHRNERLRKVLEDIVRNDKNTYISITAHGGAVDSALAVLGHRPFKLVTGAMIPVVVKVTFMKEKYTPPKLGPSITPPSCTADLRAAIKTSSTVNLTVSTARVTATDASSTSQSSSTASTGSV